MYRCKALYLLDVYMIYKILFRTDKTWNLPMYIVQFTNGTVHKHSTNAKMRNKEQTELYTASLPFVCYLGKLVLLSISSVPAFLTPSATKWDLCFILLNPLSAKRSYWFNRMEVSNSPRQSVQELISCFENLLENIPYQMLLGWCKCK